MAKIIHFLSVNEWYTKPTVLQLMDTSRINPFKLSKTMLFTYKTLTNCKSNSQMKVDFQTQLKIFNSLLNIYTMNIQKCKVFGTRRVFSHASKIPLRVTRTVVSDRLDDGELICKKMLMQCIIKWDIQCLLILERLHAEYRHSSTWQLHERSPKTSVKNSIKNGFHRRLYTGD